MLIDTHCHLDFPEFEADFPAVLTRARAAGVGHMITISTRVSQYETYRDLANAHPHLWFTIGTHPHQAQEEPDIQVETLCTYAQHPKCVAIGEAGLDYHYDRAPREIAQKVFRTHIAAARVSGLPLVIHAREADEDMAHILREEMAHAPFSALLHCFTASYDLARTGLELGLSISFSGVITFKNSQYLREIAKHVPLDRLIIETDSPFLAPIPHRGHRNEPAYVAHIADVLAQVKGLSREEIADRTTQNALNIFKKISREAV